ILKLSSYRIFARKCIVKEIDHVLCKKFVDKYHLQKYCNSKFCYGLYYGKYLVAVMTFGNLRRALGQIAKEGTYELLRFCTVNNFHIIGGASKMFAHFINTQSPQKIISYADRRWSNGNLYVQL